MSEVLHNKTRTTCSGSYTAGSGTLNVTSAASITPTCSVAILNQADLTDIKALLTVSAKATNALTVASEGIDNNAVNGDVVAVVNTRRSLGNYIGLVLLEQHTASGSAALSFTDWYSSDYDEYIVEFVNVVPATNVVDFRMRVSTNGGSSYDSGANYGHGVVWWNVGGTSQSYATGQTSIRLSGDTVSSDSSLPGINGHYRLFNPANASAQKVMDGQFAVITDVGGGAGRETVLSDGTYQSTTAYNAFQVYFSTGNIATGSVRIYGIRK